MRRPINWFVFSIALVFLFANLLLSGCGGGGEAGEGVTPPPPPVSGMLRKVSSAAELEASLKSSLQDVVVTAAPAGGVFTAMTAGGDFSSTYTAEAGVDEFDYVRYDGTHLYVAPSRFAVAGTAAPLRILRTDAVAGSATEISTIAIDADKQVMGIYVADGRLVMLSSEVNYAWRGPFGIAWTTIAYWEPTELEIRVFNVVDPAHPVEILSAELDGAFVETRRVGDRVYLITRHAPSVLRLPDTGTRLPGMSLDELLPKFRSAGRTRALVEASDCYITNEATPHGYPILTTITSFSIRNPNDLVSTCYNERATGVYASTTALYVSQQDFTVGPAATRIHKFSFTGGAPAYAGSVQVPGYLWTGGQRDFRMNEYQGMLRVMVTEQTSDPGDWQDHRLFVLRPKPNELALEVVSSLPSDARPAEIGKPGEALHGVRFLGDRAFAVTFRQIDPLYVLDLANPEDPRIAGELEIPGFSEFLHPVTQNLLLGIGSTELRNVKLELFDVSVLESPQSRGSLVIGGVASYTEAMTDRHAFTYLPSDTADRFAIPSTVTSDLGTAGWRDDSSLHQFEILGKQTAASASLQAAGIVTPPVANDAERVVSTSRAYIHGDTVFYVRDGKVWSTLWSAPSQVRGPF
jgi:uncharacterized secreted protein with C-terminal beta-propeller domain